MRAAYVTGWMASTEETKSGFLESQVCSRWQVCRSKYMAERFTCMCVGGGGGVGCRSASVCMANVKR